VSPGKIFSAFKLWLARKPKAQGGYKTLISNIHLGIKYPVSFLDNSVQPLRKTANKEASDAYYMIGISLR
jgi:hypothetical protein